MELNRKEVNSAEEADIRASQKYSGDIDTPKMSDHIEEPTCPSLEEYSEASVNPEVEAVLPQIFDEDTPPMPECKPPREEPKTATLVDGLTIREIHPGDTVVINREIPESCVEHQHKYKQDAWKTYTIQELGMWVHLFLKRAEHRKDKVKARKDVMDAQNYLNMMQSELDAVRKEVS